MVNEEVRNRIRVSIAACCYELLDESFMSDSEYDMMSLQINPQEPTGNPKLDEFFKEHFSPDTGSWVRKHPELKKLKELSEKLLEARS